jgi:hypothetical protein
MKRRTALAALGAVIAGGGAVLGTGAFTTVQAERSVSIEVTEDSRALVGIDVNDRYGGQTDNGVAEFNLQENLFSDTGFNPRATTILYGALAITNNSGIEGDEMSVEFAYESSSVDVPDNQETPDTLHEGQFSFRAFDSSNTPSDIDPFEGLNYNGDASDVAAPGAISTGETAVFDLVVDPGGDLTANHNYLVDVTIAANVKGA